MGDTPVSDQFPGNVPGNYVVSAGDTLRGIALAMFGDAQLWYLIADANGLKSDADLRVGLNLVMPNKVTNLRNAHDTFKPYEPGKIIGDTTPTLPNPPPPPAPKKKGKKGCGGVGAIVVAVVAIVATVMTAGALAGVAAQGFSASMAALGGTGVMATSTAAALGTFGTALVAGAVGSIVSQGIGMALGMQDKFSWGAVAVSALSSGLTYGTGPGGLAGQMGIKEGLTQAVVNGAVNNTISQGVGIVVGVQDKFSWQAVAASAVAGGVSYGIGKVLPDGFGNTPGTFDSFTRDFTKGLGSGVASRLVSGGKANWGGVAADTFGNALGYSIVQQSGGGSGMAQQAAELQRAEQESTFPGLNPYAASGQGLRLNGGGLAYEPSLDGGSGAAETDSSRVRTVTVRAGDTLTRVAGTADPQTLDQIAQFNGLRSRHEIKAGQTLNIPDGEILSRISVSGSVAARGAAGAAYYADLQQQRAEMAAQAATANYGNEGRSMPEAIMASGRANTTPSGTDFSNVGLDGWDYAEGQDYQGSALVKMLPDADSDYDRIAQYNELRSPKSMKGNTSYVEPAGFRNRESGAWSKDPFDSDSLNKTRKLTDLKSEVKISYEEKLWYAAAGKEMAPVYKDENLVVGARLFSDTYGSAKVEYNVLDPKLEAKAQASARAGMEVVRGEHRGVLGSLEYDATLGGAAANMEAVLAVSRSSGPNPVSLDAGLQGGLDAAVIKGQAKAEREFRFGSLVIKPGVVAEGHLLGVGLYGSAGFSTYKTKFSGQLYIGAGLTAIIGGRLKGSLGIAWDPK